MASITAADINDDSSDDCGIASLTATPLAFNCGDVGANTVTLTVTDASGNSSDCTGTVVVEDPAGDDPDFLWHDLYDSIRCKWASLFCSIYLRNILGQLWTIEFICIG